jgi:hypothetical protein
MFGTLSSSDGLSLEQRDTNQGRRKVFLKGITATGTLIGRRTEVADYTHLPRESQLNRLPCSIA